MDYLTGLWSTLDIPDISHNLAVALSDVHLAYMGNCNFSLLCKNTELHTKARKLFKRNVLKHITIEKKLQVSIHHLDDKKICPEVKKSTTDKDYLSRYLDTQFQHKYLSIKLTRLEIMENVHENKNSMSSNYADSEDTEVYELEERIIGTLTFINNTEEVKHLECRHKLIILLKTTKRKSSQVLRNRNNHSNFKCPFTNCQTHAKTGKEIDLHYKTVHVSLNHCKFLHQKVPYPIQSKAAPLHAYCNIKNNWPHMWEMQ